MREATLEFGSEKWRNYGLKIFFSADIVGSTALKQKPKEDANRWFATVMSFYHQAELEFLKQWSEFKEQIKDKSTSDIWFGESPSVWKTLGDEILFVKDVEHYFQAYLAVRAWCLTLEEIRKTFRMKDGGGLDVKSSSWLADFPLKNRELVLGKKIPNGEDDYDYLNELALSFYYGNRTDTKTIDRLNLVRDFVGPSIDTGFRLGAFTSPRKLVVSVELAYLLACEQSYAEENEKWHAIGPTNISRFVFRYDERHVLKGVFGGKPYPIFWIDLDPENKMHKAEEDLLSQVRPSASKIKNFTEAVFEEFKDYIKPPMFSKDLEFSETKSNGFANCHKILCQETLTLIKIYQEEIAGRENKRAREAEDIRENEPGNDSGSSLTRNKFREMFLEFERQSKNKPS